MVHGHRHPSDGLPGPGPAVAAEANGPWGVCEVLLVADRSRGATHSFFEGWRFEVVMCSGRPTAGTALVAVPLAPRDLAASGWRYEFRLEEERAGPPGVGRPAFSWTATAAPGRPDPLAAALGQARAWLAANGWEQDPLNPTRYHG